MTRPAVDLRDVLFDARTPEHRISRQLDWGVLLLVGAAIGAWGVVGAFAYVVWHWVLQ